MAFLRSEEQAGVTHYSGVAFNKFDHYLPVLIALLLSCNFVSFMPHIGNSLYLLCGMFLIYGISKGGLKLSPLSMFFFFVCLISIPLNDIPSIVNPWMRLGLFVAVGFLTGNFVGNIFLDILRIRLFFAVEWVFLFVTLLSAIGKILGFSLMKYSNFVGYTGHSAILGFVAAQGLMFILFLNSHYSEQIGKNRRLFKIAWFGAFLCMLMLLGAASRTALLACIGGCFVFYYYAYKRHRKKLIKFSAVAALVLSVSYPLWSSYTQQLINKNGGDVKQLNISSRQGLWEQSYAMFERHPLLGVGFSNVQDEEYSGFTNAIGGFEIGNSYLAVMVMTGIMGLIPFIMVCLEALVNVIKRYRLWEDKVLTSYMGGVLAFFLLHMLGEGYVTSGGNLCFFIFWLHIGCIQGFSRQGNVYIPYLPDSLILHKHNVVV